MTLHHIEEDSVHINLSLPTHTRRTMNACLHLMKHGHHHYHHPSPRCKMPESKLAFNNTSIFKTFHASPGRSSKGYNTKIVTPSASVSKLQHVVITGGNSGIGKATATELAKQGMSVVIACRSKERGDIACSEITQLSGNPNVKAMVCDLGSFNSIHNFVREYKEEKLPLHVLVNNAGIMACPQSYTKDGFEQQFGVNHLGHFLLSALLLETLINSASSGSSSRIVVLASAAERIGSIDFSDLNFKYSRGYNPWIAYGQSKLANCLFSYELSRRCKAANIRVTSNCMHPGIVDTQLIRYILPQMMSEKSVLPGLRLFILKLLGLKTPEEGASTAVHLASSEDLEGISGFYFEDCQIKKPSSQAQDSKLASRLWEVSENLTRTHKVFLELGLGSGSVQGSKSKGPIVL